MYETIPFFSCARGLWPGAELYILGMSLNHLLTELKISVNIYARTLKFGMQHPCMQSLRFRRNKL